MVRVCIHQMNTCSNNHHLQFAKPTHPRLAMVSSKIRWQNEHIPSLAERGQEIFNLLAKMILGDDGIWRADGAEEAILLRRFGFCRGHRFNPKFYSNVLNP